MTIFRPVLYPDYRQTSVPGYRGGLHGCVGGKAPCHPSWDGEAQKKGGHEEHLRGLSQHSSRSRARSTPDGVCCTPHITIMRDRDSPTSTIFIKPLQRYKKIADTEASCTAKCPLAPHGQAGFGAHLPLPHPSSPSWKGNARLQKHPTESCTCGKKDINLPWCWTRRGNTRPCHHTYPGNHTTHTTA